MTITEAELSEMTFGIELEYDRIDTRKAAETVAAAVGGTYRYDGSHLSNWVVTMPDGRKWNCETDSSVHNGSVSCRRSVLRCRPPRKPASR